MITDDSGHQYTAALFDVAVNPKPEPPAKLTGRAAYHRRIARRIGAGEHPLGQGIRLHPDAPRDLDSVEAQRSTSTGPRCGTCVFRVRDTHHDKTYPKCYLPTVIGGRETYPRVTHSEASDVAGWWPACTDWKGKDQ